MVRQCVQNFNLSKGGYWKSVLVIKNFHFFNCEMLSCIFVFSKKYDSICSLSDYIHFFKISNIAAIYCAFVIIHFKSKNYFKLSILFSLSYSYDKNKYNCIITMRGFGIKLRSKTTESEILPKQKKSVSTKVENEQKGIHSKLNQYPRSIKDYFSHIQSKVLFEKMAQINYHSNNLCGSPIKIKQKANSQNKSQRQRIKEISPKKQKDKNPQNPQNSEKLKISYEDEYLSILRKTQHFKTTFLVNNSHWKDKIMRRKNIGSYGEIYKGRAKKSQICSANLIKPETIQEVTKMKTQGQVNYTNYLQVSYNCKTVQIEESQKQNPSKYKISVSNVQKMRRTCGDNITRVPKKNRKQSVRQGSQTRIQGKNKNQGWVFQPW